MIKIVFSEADITALRYWRFQHPDPRVQVRMEALYLRSQGVANARHPAAVWHFQSELPSLSQGVRRGRDRTAEAPRATIGHAVRSTNHRATLEA